MNIIAIIQARMGSTRLPGKVMAEVIGRPLLYYVVTRAQQAQKLNLVVVATSTHQADDVIEDFCRQANIPCFRGSEEDVLDRYYQAATYFKADVVVRLTADCPLIDAQVIDKVIQTFLDGEFDYVSNTLQCTYPDGLDTEVFLFTALKRAWQEAQLKSEREHVTPYIKHPGLFRLGNVRHSEDLSTLRWTVDEPRDITFIRAVYERLGSAPFGMGEVLNLLKAQPHLSQVNAGIERDEGYQKSLRDDRVIT